MTNISQIISLQSKIINFTWLHQIKNWFINKGLSIETADILLIFMKIIFVLLLVFVAYLISNKIINWLIPKYIKRTTLKWDNILLQHKVFKAFAYFFPAIIIFYTAYLFENEFVVKTIRKLVVIIITIILLHFFTSLLNAVNEIYSFFEKSKKRNIKIYVQIVKVILCTISILFIISFLLGMTINMLWKMLVSFGAFATLLLIIYKDSIVGFVAGIQLSANKMVEIGDWISVPKLNADGIIIDIALTSVKIRNWDKSYTTIPVYLLVSDSFINWRGMQESGVRRIKRDFLININSIRFLKPAEVDNFKQKIDININDMVNKGEQNLEKSKSNKCVKQTNVGLFRSYITTYLNKHHGISKNHAITVRQLQPTEKGLPLQIYAFSADNIWKNYTNTLSAITEYILAIAKEFELSIFQNPTGQDVNSALKNNE